MTEQWKPIGDKWPQPAMVFISRNHGGTVTIAGPSALYAYDIPKYCIQPMPPSITPEQQAVLDAAEAWLSHGTPIDRDFPLADAVLALRKSQQPPDPVKELRAAWQEFISDTPCTFKRMEAAIVALEAKS